MRVIRRLALYLAVLLVMTPGLVRPAAAVLLMMDDEDLPPVVEDWKRPSQCTATWLVQDLATNDMLAVRMRITPAPNIQAVDGRLPCPPNLPTRMADRALDACAIRAANKADCVFADMDRGFAQSRDVRRTSVTESRCTSDTARFIGVACFKSKDIDVCSVGCGDEAADAVAAARKRCEARHQMSCSVTAAVPVPVP